MKVIKGEELKKYDISRLAFTSYGGSRKALCSKELVELILDLKENEYIFVSKEEWTLKSSVTIWLNGCKNYKKSELYQTKVKSRKCLIPQEGWIIGYAN